MNRALCSPLSYAMAEYHGQTNYRFSYSQSRPKHIGLRLHTFLQNLSEIRKLCTIRFSGISISDLIIVISDDLQELFAGGLMMGAFFMATDYVSSPYTKSGRILFALIIGVMTWLYRMFGMYKEGVSNAIILANCLTPLIDRLTRPVAFGIRKKEASS